MTMSENRKTESFRAIAEKVSHLELTVLPALKGEPERILRELIWEAHDLLKQQPRLRKCEACGGPGPTLHDPRTQRYSCQKCHSEPHDEFFHRATAAMEKGSGEA